MTKKNVLTSQIAKKKKGTKKKKKKLYFFSSFSASAALFNRAPRWRSFVRSTRSLLYALNDFISSVTFTNKTEGFSRAIGMYGPWTWVAVESSSAVESPAYRNTEQTLKHQQGFNNYSQKITQKRFTLILRAHLGNTTSLAL